MENRQQQQQGLEIDVFRLIGAVLRRAWLVIIAMVIGGVGAFSYAYLKIPPTYSSSVLLFVNASSSLSNVKVSVSGADRSNAQRLIDTYLAILKTRMTLEEVIKRADLPHSYGSLRGMVSGSAVDGTEIFSVNVVDTDPVEAQKIANTIAVVLPEKISEIIDGTSVRIVDYAVVPQSRMGPDLRSYALKGVAAGALLCCGIIVLIELMDDGIHSEEYLVQTYDIPILGLIPDIAGSEGRGYYHYRKGYGYGRRYGYGYRRGYGYRKGYGYGYGYGYGQPSSGSEAEKGK